MGERPSHAELADRDAKIARLEAELAAKSGRYRLGEALLDAVDQLQGITMEGHDPKTTDGLLEMWVRNRDEIVKLKNQLEDRSVIIHDADAKNIGVWYYQGDEYDNLGSLTCPVLISATKLRDIIQERDDLQETVAAIRGELQAIMLKLH